MVLVMKTCDKIALDKILLHKEYFDSKLIQLVENNEKQITTLCKTIDILKITISKHKELIKKLSFTNKNEQIINTNLSKKIKAQEEETVEIIKDFEKKIEEMDKTVQGELQKSYHTNVELQDENMRLKEELKKLRRENTKYKNMFHKNSSNSSIPPSKDENKVTNSRIKSDLKRGGQPGHKVHRSKTTEKPHNVIYKIVAKAPSGAVAVFNEHDELSYYKTQEINAYLKTKITETRYIIKKNAESLPEKEMNKYRINHVAYHEDFKSMVLYLNSKGTIALKRLCTILNEMSKGMIDLKASTVVNWGKEFHKKSANYMENLLNELIKTDVLYVDETGWKINGQRAWMHVIASNDGAYFMVTKSRGSMEEGPLEILKGYTGCLVHDHYKPYYNLELCQHAECNAHILRYLANGAELDKNEACAEMKKLIQEMIHRKKELIKQTITKMEDSEIKMYEEKYHRILKEELEKYDREHPVKPKAIYIPDYIKLMKRMEEYSEEHLLFIKDFRVPSENNRAERQMRPTKAKKKISGQSTNLETANDFAAIHTVIQTCSLQGKNTLEEIKTILKS